MENFPIEITTITLSLLPVKSILRFRSVCKTWLSIIDDPQFPLTHLSSTTKAKHEKNKLSFMFYDGKQTYVAEASDDNINIIKTRKVRLSPIRPMAYAVYSCNGLVCTCFVFYDKPEDSYVKVCNPVMRTSVTLPYFNSPECSATEFKPYLVAGFGLDLLSNEYKVVVIFSGAYGGSCTNQEVQVYTLGSNSWRKIGYAPQLRFNTTKSVYLSGYCHWLPQVEKDGVWNAILVSFNFGSEEFGFIEFPPDCRFRPNFKSKFHFLELGGFFSIADSSCGDCIDIWIMKQYNVKESWTRYLVKNGNNICWKKSCYAISILKNGSLILECDRKLVSYDVQSAQCTPLEVDRLYKDGYRGFSYVESLIPLTKKALQTASPSLVEAEGSKRKRTHKDMRKKNCKRFHSRNQS